MILIYGKKFAMEVQKAVILKCLVVQRMNQLWNQFLMQMSNYVIFIVCEAELSGEFADVLQKPGIQVHNMRFGH